MFETHFSWIDILIIAVYIAGTALLGAYVNRHIHGSADYLLGGRTAGAALNAASFIGTELGLVTVMFSAMEGFQSGFSYFMTPLIWGLVTLLIGTTGIGIARMRRLELTTIPEYFERRYSRNVRLTAGIMCFVAGAVNTSIFPKISAVFLTFACGYGGSEDVEVIVDLTTTVLIVLVVAYTLMGGMVAVIVTDYLQFIVAGAGLLIGVLYCLNNSELGWNSVVQSWSVAKGDQAFNPFTADRYGWTYVLVQIWFATAAMLCWSPNASRSLTSDSEATTKHTFVLGSSGMFARFAIPGLWGVVAFAYLTSPSVSAGLAEYFGPQSIAEDPARAAEAMPLLMGKLLPTGLLGILMAGMLAAFMSTHDSYLMAFATVGGEDVVGPLLGRPLTSSESIWTSRILIVLIGVFSIVVGIWFPLPEEVFPFLVITGSIWLSGAATALLGGMYWRRASSTGAIIGLFSGFTVALALFDKPIQWHLAHSLGHLRPDGAVDTALVSYYVNTHSLTLGSFLLGVVLFVVGSLAFPDRMRSEDSSFS